MLHKSFPYEFKKLDDSGTFEATVAVFGNVDKGGDRIMPGAFEKSLAQWEASGDPIPVIFNHDWGTPDAHIGVVEKAIETEQGLLVKGRLDVEDNPVAKQVHRLMMRRSLREFSFGYSVPKGGEKRAKDGAMDLTEIEIAEVGPTLKGMNPATELHSVKSAMLDNQKELIRLAGESGPDVLAAVTAAVNGGIGGRVGLGFQGTSDLHKELQEVKARLDVLEAKAHTPEKKAEETDQTPRRSATSVDPLRRDSDTLAANVALGEVPTSPASASRQAPDDDLKRRSRDLMLDLLSE
jgi:HK97 family phage prohead protease